MKWVLSVFLTFSFVFLAVFGLSCFYGTLFPIKYQEEISAACAKYDVEEAVIFALINTESHFNKDAISCKGAVGLMQVLPTTATSLAGQEVDLSVPATNIDIGTKYFSHLLSRFENVETALCAYNAGPTNVQKWLLDSELSDDGVTLKKIPFAETKGYIERFRKNYKYYKSKV